MAESLGEKTEAPTERRRTEARERGQVGKSTDLASAIVLLGAVLGVTASIGGLLQGGVQVMRRGLSAEAFQAAMGVGEMGPGSFALLWSGARLAVPIMLVMAAAAYAAHAVQTGGRLAPKALKPKLDKFDLVKGVGRLLSKRSLVRGSLDVLKLLVVGAVVYAAVSAHMGEVSALGRLPLAAAVAEAARILLIVAVWTLVALFVLGLLDLSYQKWQTGQDLKMTKQEVKDERKSSEGDVESKGRRMRMARDIAMQRLERDVPGADVVVANPTHVSVALRYRADEGAAPVVVAKGADYMAMKIRYIAQAHGVAIVERPPLARALYRDVRVGGQVRPEHYEAVAEVLAYVYRLEGRAAGGGRRRGAAA